MKTFTSAIGVITLGVLGVFIVAYVAMVLGGITLGPSADTKHSHTYFWECRESMTAGFWPRVVVVAKSKDDALCGPEKKMKP